MYCVCIQRFHGKRVSVRWKVDFYSFSGRRPRRSRNSWRTKAWRMTSRLVFLKALRRKSNCCRWKAPDENFFYWHKFGVHCAFFFKLGNVWNFVFKAWFHMLDIFCRKLFALHGPSSVERAGGFTFHHFMPFPDLVPSVLYKVCFEHRSYNGQCELVCGQSIQYIHFWLNNHDPTMVYSKPRLLYLKRLAWIYMVAVLFDWWKASMVVTGLGQLYRWTMIILLEVGWNITSSTILSVKRMEGSVRWFLDSLQLERLHRFYWHFCTWVAEEAVHLVPLRNSKAMSWLRSFDTKRFQTSPCHAKYVKQIDFRPLRILDYALTFYHFFLNEWMEDGHSEAGNVSEHVDPHQRLISHLWLQSLDAVTPDLKLMIEERLQKTYSTTCPDVVAIFGSKILPRIRNTLEGEEFARLSKQNLAKACVLESWMHSVLLASVSPIFKGCSKRRHV